MCLEAINQNYNALKYIKNHTMKICLEYDNQNTILLNYIDNDRIDQLKITY